MKFCSYLIGSFQNFLEQILSYSLFKVAYWIWFAAFFYEHIRDAGEGLVKAEYLHITAAVRGPFADRVIIH